MNKIKENIQKRFPNIYFKEIIPYRNPNEFTQLYIERVNPNHVGIIWGKRHKKYNKGCHYVMCGKVFFSLWHFVLSFMVLGYFDYFTKSLFNGLFTIGIYGCILGFTVSFLFYALPLYLFEKQEAKKCFPLKA